MRKATFGNLRQIRKALGKSQSELASLVGVSTRAIQSYEQGWRHVPAYVQRHALLLLFLSRRGGAAQAKPCWEVRGCLPDILAECPAHQFHEGNLCWLVTGTLCEGKELSSWDDKMSQCAQCPAFQQHFCAKNTPQACSGGRDD